MNAWVFDIDGVITDPVSKKADHKILKHLSNILQNGDFVSFNTGRSFVWTKDVILDSLLEYVTDHSLLKNVFVICEMGNVLAVYKDSEWQKRVLDDSLPEVIQKEIKKIIEEEFSECMFFDETKETMITAEMKEGFSMDLFKKRVKSLEEKVNAILMNKKYASLELRAVAGHISLDVQYEDAGKHLGAERIEDFMMENGIKPETVYMLGDSNSDSQMAQELEGSHKVIFVFVNDKSALKDTPMCEIIYTKEKFTNGTLEFLNNVLA